MNRFDLSTEKKLEKVRLGKFDMDDLSEYFRKKVKPDTAVVPLQDKNWTKAGGYWLFLNDVYIGMEDAWIEVLVVPDVGFFSFISFAYMRLLGEVVSVADWNTIPGTNLAFEMWFVGDGVNRVPLVVEVVEKKEVEG